MSSDEIPIPAVVRMYQLLSGFQVSQALFVVAELGVSTALLSGPRAIKEVAGEVGADADVLKRVIRLLAPFGVFRIEGDEVSVTDLGRTLAVGPADSMRGLARYMITTQYAAYTELLHTVRTGEVAATRYLGKPFFDWVTESPGLVELQNQCMGEWTSFARGDLLDVVIVPAGETIADIGGADGTLLVEVLARYPDRRGIVFDRPNVVMAATANLAVAGLGARATAVGGDFFERVPAADVYLLSSVLHDWDDASAIRILRNIVRSAPEDARLVLIELVVPEADSPHVANFIDVHMMAILGGRERTESQWRRLLADGGFTVDRVVVGSGLYSAVEATLRRN